MTKKNSKISDSQTEIEKAASSAPEPVPHDVTWEGLPPELQHLFSGIGVTPENAVMIMQHISFGSLTRWRGPIPPPDVLRELKEIGVLDDVMQEFHETSKAQNAERLAKAAAIGVQAECQRKLAFSRTFNDTFYNIKHCIIVLAVLGIIFFILYQGFSLIKAGKTVSGSIFSGVGIAAVLISIVRAGDQSRNPRR